MNRGEKPTWVKDEQSDEPNEETEEKFVATMSA
jgi:hypothetical protein